MRHILSIIILDLNSAKFYLNLNKELTLSKIDYFFVVSFILIASFFGLFKFSRNKKLLTLLQNTTYSFNWRRKSESPEVHPRPLVTDRDVKAKAQKMKLLLPPEQAKTML